MRYLTTWLLAVVFPLAAILAGALVTRWAAALSPAAPRLSAPWAQAAPATTGTPIVEPSPSPVPTPEPRPLYLPFVPDGYDPRAPGPVPAAAQGFVAKLTVAGRRACAPASHVLLSEPEGTVATVPLALLHSARPDPPLNLDLYLGDYVEVTGLSSMKPSSCPIDTWQLMAVRAIELRERPPRARRPRIMPEAVSPTRSGSGSEWPRRSRCTSAPWTAAEAPSGRRQAGSSLPGRGPTGSS